MRRLNVAALREGNDVGRSDDVRMLDRHRPLTGRGADLAACDPEGGASRTKLSRHVLDEEPKTGEIFLRTRDEHLVNRIRRETPHRPGAGAEFAPLAVEDHLPRPGERVGEGIPDFERLPGAAQ